MAEPGMDGLAVEGAPVCVPVRLRSAADGDVVSGSGVKVFIWFGGAGADDLDLPPKQMARTPLVVGLNQLADGLAGLGHKPVLAKDPHEALIA